MVLIQNMITPNMVVCNLVTPNMVARNLDTLNMVTLKLLGTPQLHRHGCVQRWRSANFLTFIFNLSSDDILVTEHGSMYGWMNGAYSDNVVSI